MGWLIDFYLEIQFVLSQELMNIIGKLPYSGVSILIRGGFTRYDTLIAKKMLRSGLRLVDRVKPYRVMRKKVKGKLEK